MRNNKIKIAIIIVLALLIIGGIGIGTFIIIKNNQEANTIDSIQISAWPKQEYSVGDTADYSGLQIQVIMQNGDVKTVSYLGNEQDFEFSGFNSQSVVESQRITVRYKQEFTTSFNVKIKEKQGEALVLSHITISVLPQTEYSEGEWINVAGGMIMRHYTNGTQSQTLLLSDYIDEASWLNAYNSGAGEDFREYDIIVRYAEGGILKETTFTITIRK